MLKKIDMNAIEPEVFSPLMKCEDEPKLPKKSKKKNKNNIETTVTPVDGILNIKDDKKPKRKIKIEKQISPRSPPLSGHNQKSKPKQHLQLPKQSQQQLSAFEKLKQDPNYVSFDKESDQGEMYIVVLRLAKSPTEPISGTERILKLKSGETIQNIKKKLLDNGSGNGRFGFSDISMFMDGKELINPFSLVDIPKISQERKADINVIIKCDPPLTSLPQFKSMSSVPAESSSKEEQLDQADRVISPPPQLPLQKQNNKKQQKSPEDTGSNNSNKNIKLDLNSLSKGKDTKIKIGSPTGQRIRITLLLVNSLDDDPSGPSRIITIRRDDDAYFIKKMISQSLKSELSITAKVRNVKLYLDAELLDDDFNSFTSDTTLKVIIKKPSKPVTELPPIISSNSASSEEEFSAMGSTSFKKSNTDESHKSTKDEESSTKPKKLSLPKQQPQQQQQLSAFEKLKQDPNYVSFDKESDQGEMYIVVLRLAKSPTEPISGTERILKLKSGETIQNIKKKLLDNGSGNGRFGFSDISMFMDGKELINPFSLVDIPKISQERKADINVIIKCDPPLTSLPQFKSMSSVPAESSSKEEQLEQADLFLSPPSLKVPNKKKKTLKKKVPKSPRPPSSSSYSSGSGSSFSSSRFSGSRSSSSYSSSSSRSYSRSYSGSSYSSGSSFSGSTRSSAFSSVGSGFALDIPDGVKKSSISEMKVSFDNNANRTGEDTELKKIYDLKSKEGNSTRRSGSSSDTNISKSDKENENETGQSSSDGGVDIDVDDDGESSSDGSFGRKPKSRATPDDRYRKKQKKSRKDKRKRSVKYSDSERSDFGSSYGSSYTHSYSSKFSRSGRSSSRSRSSSSLASSSSSRSRSSRSRSSLYSSRSRSSSLSSSRSSQPSSSSSSSMSSSSRSSISSSASSSSSSLSTSFSLSSRFDDKGKYSKKSARSKSPHGKNQKRKQPNSKMEFLISELEFTYNNTKRTANKRIKKLKRELNKKNRIIEELKAEREVLSKPVFMPYNPQLAMQPQPQPQPQPFPSANEFDPPSPPNTIPMSARFRYNQIPPLSIAQGSQPPPPPLSAAAASQLPPLLQQQQQSQQQLPVMSSILKSSQSTLPVPQSTPSIMTVQNPMGSARSSVNSGIRSPPMLSPVGSWCGSSNSGEEGSTVNESYNSNMVIINMLNNDKQQLLNDKQALINQLFERNREYDILKEKYESLKKKYGELKDKKQ